MHPFHHTGDPYCTVWTVRLTGLAPGALLLVEYPNPATLDPHDDLIARRCPGRPELGVFLLVDGAGDTAVPAPHAEGIIDLEMVPRPKRRSIASGDVEDPPACEDALGACLDTETAPDAVPRIDLRDPLILSAEDLDAPGRRADHHAGE